MPSDFIWLGEKVKEAINQSIDAEMNRFGREVTALAAQKAPKRTGRLVQSIGYRYDQAARRVTIHADAPYAFFVEFGTRLRRAQPYLRPALLQARKPFGVSAELQFGELSSSGATPTPRANVSAMAHNAKANRALSRSAGKHAPRVVFSSRAAHRTGGHQGGH